ncbi:serine hydrolase domain-containing protein [Sporosarcina cyprini]|uniref:serine hydrolase domain-containing protein n=1 Tax=Sporosarcina cyprini TaxID=2910523 RepID=UPI001EDE4927|nr:serine hydrolase domain-containing protein [Sporosarcina cyprini]MCG3089769.1 beta-lactamase family protein [Sporosarcina cyprini]
MKETVTETSMEQHAAEWVEKGLVPGAMLGIKRDGESIFEKGFGFRNVEAQLPVTADTVFGIASMTKSFTCAGIMKLQEEGKLSVRDLIVTYLPELKGSSEQAEQITIHHLMTHTAGYPPLATHVYARKNSIEADPSAKDYGLDLLNNPGPHIETYDEMLAFMANDDFKWLGAPGEYYSYSNDSYGLLGVIIARASGQSYESFIEENVLIPAGMTRSFFDMKRLDELDDVTTLYMKAKDGSHVYEAPLWWDAPSMRAVGYLKSTANDILRYLEMYMNEGVVAGVRILSKESIEQMMTPHVEYEPGKCYGYGLRIIPDYFGSKLISHGGGLKGVSSYMVAIPDKKLSGVILTNVADVEAGDLLMDALNKVEGRSYDASPFTYDTQQVTEEELRKFEGVYISGEGMNVEIAMRNGQFGVESNGVFRPLRCIGKNVFMGLEDQSDILQFVENDSGEIERIVYGGRHILRQ